MAQTFTAPKFTGTRTYLDDKGRLTLAGAALLVCILIAAGDAAFWVSQGSWKDAAMRLRIATTQPVATSDAGQNGSKARELMRRAAAEGARLIHFPEGFLSGYAKEQIADWDDVDWAAVRAELRAIAQLAAELRIWVVLGSAHPR